MRSKLFFDGSHLDRAWKATFLTLIPKTEQPKDFCEFRPVSLCNVNYKIISKIMSKRLAVILPKLISDEQGAFVHDRMIHENIALTQELVQSLDQGNLGGNVILNLDMEKAYDRLDWGFLHEVLRKFEFSENWLHLIKQCVEENSFSVLVDGVSTPFFKSSRGLRQGDPISPSLFVLAEEVLSRGISSLLFKEKVLPFLVKKRCPVISHSLFIDDILIFMNGRRSSVANLMEFLSKYQLALGKKSMKPKATSCPLII